jgi:ATP-binding cassette subfamily F protein 3
VRHLLEAEGLDKEFQGKRVLADAKLWLDEGERVGLIGRNGCGKTTLLRLLTGDVAPDAGELRLSRGLRVAVMHQHFELDPSTGVREALSTSEEYYIALGSPPKRNPVAIGDDLWRKLAARLLLTEEMQARTVSELSGGERTKVALARALAVAPGVDLLLLDEPTSHLDIPTMEWLEGTVAGLKCACVVVSHDRYFLDRTVTRLLELEEGGLTSHQGNYSAYAERREKARREQEVRHAKQQHEIERIQRSVEEMRRRWTYDSGRYKHRERALERMEPVEAPREERGPGILDFAHEAKSGREMVVFEDVSFSRGSRKVIDGVSFTIENGERVGLIGVNGSGKSTVAKLIMKRLDPDEGRVRVVGRTIPGYFAQEHEGLDPGRTGLEEISIVQPSMQEKTVRGLLAAMGLGREASDKPVAKLSGGERARLALLKLVLSPTNLLVLDEPTNYLDTQSREAVEEALLGYEGSLLLITHDRYLLDKVTTRTFALDCSRLESYPGSYSAYRAGRRVALGKGGRNRYIVAKNYTDWSTRIKYRIGQVLELTPDEEDRHRWAIENRVLAPSED